MFLRFRWGRTGKSLRARVVSRDLLPCTLLQQFYRSLAPLLVCASISPFMRTLLCLPPLLIFGTTGERARVPKECASTSPLMHTYLLTCLFERWTKMIWRANDCPFVKSIVFPSTDSFEDKLLKQEEDPITLRQKGSLFAEGVSTSKYKLQLNQLLCVCGKIRRACM